jgi:hypothetical protein
MIKLIGLCRVPPSREGETSLPGLIIDRPLLGIIALHYAIQKLRDQFL